MAGSQVDKTVAIDYFQEAVLGYEAVSISNYDNTSEPKVQAGAVIEISQELYEFGSEETLTGWSGISDSTQAYIYFVPSGTSCTVIFSTTAPTWNDAKNGWYNGNDRALYSVYRTSASVYTDKLQLEKEKNPVFSNNVHVSGIANLNSIISDDLTSGHYELGIGAVTQNDFFDYFDPIIPNTGDMLLCSGRFKSANDGQISYIQRASGTQLIIFYFIDGGGAAVKQTADDGNGSTLLTVCNFVYIKLSNYTESVS